MLRVTVSSQVSISCTSTFSSHKCIYGVQNMYVCVNGSLNTLYTVVYNVALMEDYAEESHGIVKFLLGMPLLVSVCNTRTVSEQSSKLLKEFGSSIECLTRSSENQSL